MWTQCATRTFVLESGFVMRKYMKTKKFFGNFFGVIGILVILWLIFSYFNVIFARPFLANWNIFKIFEGVFLKWRLKILLSKDGRFLFQTKNLLISVMRGVGWEMHCKLHRTKSRWWIRKCFEQYQNSRQWQILRF